MKIKVAAGTTISVFPTIFFADLAFAIFFVVLIFIFVKENKRMFWVQGMVQLNG